MRERRKTSDRTRQSTRIIVPFARPTISPRSVATYVKYVKDILKSGRLTLGKYTSGFERSISDFVGARRAVSMNSCTSALFSIAMAAGLRPGDEVIVPAVTFASTANAAILVGSRPVLVDSDPSTFNMSIEDTKNRTRRGKTKAIIAVHLAGNPVNLRAISEIAHDSRSLLIEDAAHALGSYYGSKHVGTFGVAGAFSFYPNKIITTGEGGCVVTENDDIAEKLELIRSVGRKGLGPTQVLAFGGNFRMSELQAALGLVLMRKVKSFLAGRKRIAEYYDRKLADMKDLVTPQRIEDDCAPSRYAYLVMLNQGINRDKVRRELLTKHGVETSILYVPLHRHPYYNRLGVTRTGLTVAEHIGHRSLALPIYGHMTLRQASYIVSSLRSVLTHVAR